MKKKTVKINIFAFLFLLFSSKTFSYSLEEVVNLAEKNNPELIKIQKELTVLKKKVKVAKKLFNPSISISLDGEELFKSPLEAGRIYIKQYLPYPKKFEIQKEVEKRKYLSEYFLLISKKENIFSDIYSNAYALWLTQKKIDIYKLYIKKLDSLLLDSFPEEDKLRIESTAYNLQIEIKKLKYQKETLLARLSQLANTQIRSVEVSLKPPVGIPDIEIFLEKIKESPFYKSVEKDIERAKEIYKLAKMIYYPDFTISVRVDTGGSLTEALSLGVGVKLPIWRTVKQEQDVLSRQIEIIAAKEKLRYIFNDIKYKIQKSYLNIRLSIEALSLVKKTIENLQREYELRRRKEKNAVILLKPLLDSLEKEIQKNEYIYIYYIEYARIKAVLGEL